MSPTPEESSFMLSPISPLVLRKRSMPAPGRRHVDALGVACSVNEAARWRLRERANLRREAIVRASPLLSKLQPRHARSGALGSRHKERSKRASSGWVGSAEPESRDSGRRRRPFQPDFITGLISSRNHAGFARQKLLLLTISWPLRRLSSSSVNRLA